MSDENNSPPSPTTPLLHRRRASFSPGQTFSDLFTRKPSTAGLDNATAAYPGPITAAAAGAQAQNRRRMSLTTIGLSGTSPTQTSPFRARRESISSIGSSSSMGNGAIDENAIEDGDAPPPTPVSPFVRRMSFGARALRDVRAGNGTATANGEGFNWSEQLRNRAESTVERTSSTSAASGSMLGARPRAPSATIPAPANNVPVAARVPDPFQERILKGDFYMD